jgi:hypothetical protein
LTIDADKQSNERNIIAKDAPEKKVSRKIKLVEVKNAT